MSTTRLYSKGSHTLYFGKFLAIGKTVHDDEVPELIESGEWFAHPSEVPQPGTEQDQDQEQLTSVINLVPGHYQALVSPSVVVKAKKTKAKKDA